MLVIELEQILLAFISKNIDDLVCLELAHLSCLSQLIYSPLLDITGSLSVVVVNHSRTVCLINQLRLGARRKRITQNTFNL